MERTYIRKKKTKEGRKGKVKREKLKKKYTEITK